MQRAKNFIYHIIEKAARIGRVPVKKNTLLMVRVDEIGDYVLWRNVLGCIRKSKRFANYRITLCGNKGWKDIALHFDKDLIDDFIWFDKKAFKSDMKYRFRFLRTIHQAGYEVLINPTFARSARNDDAIVKAAGRAYKIGMERNAHNILSFEEGYDKGLYKEDHHLPLTGLFEFERNCLFAALVTKEVCKPIFGFERALIPASPVAGKYAVIFPGSGRADRRWPVENFVKAAVYLHKEQGLAIVLAGSKEDEEVCTAFEKQFPFACTNLVMKTSLVEFITLLSKAACLLSIDTGAVHLAAAAGCKVYGIFNGAQYGRFAPYPTAILSAPFFSIYPQLINEAAHNADVYEKYQYFSPFNYESIKAEDVIYLLEKDFKQ